jgi:6,7-dimethyl-8-ribityllumazine synthase
LQEFGVDLATVEAAAVPTILELPIAVKYLMNSSPKKLDSILCVGCHENNEYSRAFSIPATVFQVLQQLSVDHMVPCVSAIHIAKVKRAMPGKITAKRLKHAKYDEDIRNKMLTKFGSEYAKRAMEMATAKQEAFVVKSVDTSTVTFSTSDQDAQQAPQEDESEPSEKPQRKKSKIGFK